MVGVVWIFRTRYTESKHIYFYGRLKTFSTAKTRINKKLKVIRKSLSVYGLFWAINIASRYAQTVIRNNGENILAITDAMLVLLPIPDSII